MTGEVRGHVELVERAANRVNLSLATDCRLLQAGLQALPGGNSAIIGNEQDRRRRAVPCKGENAAGAGVQGESPAQRRQAHGEEDAAWT